MLRTITALCLAVTGLLMADIDRSRQELFTWQDDCVGQQVLLGRGCARLHAPVQPAAAAPASTSPEPSIFPVVAHSDFGQPDERADTPEECHVIPWPPPTGPNASAPDTLLAPEAQDDTLGQRGAAASVLTWLGFVVP